MFIRNCLTDRKQLAVVNPGQSIEWVLQKMQGHLSLPCVDEEDNFIGMVSKRTIFEYFQASAMEGIPYDQFLTRAVDPCIDKTVPSLSLDAHFEDTIEIIIRHPFVPIVESARLVGIVKRGDVNHALSIAFATHVDAHRILLGMPEVEGALERLFNVTHRLGINVITAVPFDAGENPLNRRLILKVSRSKQVDQLVQQLEKAGFLVIEVSE